MQISEPAECGMRTSGEGSRTAETHKVRKGKQKGWVAIKFLTVRNLKSQLQWQVILRRANRAKCTKRQMKSRSGISTDQGKSRLLKPNQAKSKWLKITHSQTRSAHPGPLVCPFSSSLLGCKPNRKMGPPPRLQAGRRLVLPLLGERVGVRAVVRLTFGFGDFPNQPLLRARFLSL